MGNIDRELLRAAKLSVVELARILHRSHQTVSRGINRETEYLTSISDLRAIYLALSETDLAASDSFLQELRRRYPEYSSIQLASPVDIFDRHLSTAITVWIICPSIDELFFTDEDIYDKVIELLKRANIQIVFVFSSEKHIDLFREKFGTDHTASVIFEVEENVLLMPILIMFVKNTDQVTIFAISSSSLQPLPETSTRRIFRNIGQIQNRSK